MSEPLTDLEKYNRGLPLSDENAALMEGREPAAEFPEGEATAKSSDELSEDDRDWLRRLTHEPGFPILIRVLNQAIQNREYGAKLVSSVDPLANKEEIIKQWTYIACMKSVMTDIQVLIASLYTPR
jgi:hypothetical protein